jgi:hypothetical protein
VSFESLRKRSSSASRGCAVCGGRVAGRVQVKLLEPEKTNRAVTSRSRSFCEEHAEQVYTALRESLDATEPDTREAA